MPRLKQDLYSKLKRSLKRSLDKFNRSRFRKRVFGLSKDDLVQIAKDRLLFDREEYPSWVTRLYDADILIIYNDGKYKWIQNPHKLQWSKNIPASFKAKIKRYAINPKVLALITTCAISSDAFHNYLNSVPKKDLYVFAYGSDDDSLNYYVQHPQLLVKDTMNLFEDDVIEAKEYSAF